MPLNDQNFQCFSEKSQNQTGQGTLEFILIITLSVGALILVGATVLTPINTWYKSYFGNYLECLIDAAELPSLSTRTNSNENSVCEDRFQPFTLNGGRPFIGGGSNGSGNGGANGNGGDSNSGANQGGNANGSSNGSKAGSQGNESGSDGSRGGGGNGNRGVTIGARQNNPAGFGQRGEVDSKTNELASGKSELQSAKAAKSKNFRISNTNLNLSGPNSVQYLEAEGISGAINQTRFKRKNREENTRVIGSINQNSDEAGGSGGPTTRLIDKPQASKALNMGDIESPSMGLAGWLKWVLIIVVLVAIGFFVFGQVSQITKSLEK